MAYYCLYAELHPLSTSAVGDGGRVPHAQVQLRPGVPRQGQRQGQGRDADLLPGGQIPRLARLLVQPDPRDAPLRTTQQAAGQAGDQPPLGSWSRDHPDRLAEQLICGAVPALQLTADQGGRVTSVPGSLGPAGETATSPAPPVKLTRGS